MPTIEDIPTQKPESEVAGLMPGVGSPPRPKTTTDRRRHTDDTSLSCSAFVVGLSVAAQRRGHGGVHVARTTSLTDLAAFATDLQSAACRPAASGQTYAYQISVRIPPGMPHSSSTNRSSCPRRSPVIAHPVRPSIWTCLVAMWIVAALCRSRLSPLRCDGESVRTAANRRSR